MISVEIKIKPMSVNVMYQGRKYRTKEFKQYQENVLMLLPKEKELKGSLAVSLEFYLEQPYKCDLDNFIKPILDILQNKGYFKNDKQIYQIEAKKYLHSENKIKIIIIKL